MSQPSIFERLINWAIPRIGKRMFFAVTLFLSVKQPTTPEHEGLVRLNQTMHLANDISALNFPATFNGKIWDHNQLMCVLTGGCQERCPDGECHRYHLDAFIEYVLRNTPAWMLYGDRSDIETDIKTIVRVTQTWPANRLAA